MCSLRHPQRRLPERGAPECQLTRGRSLQTIYPASLFVSFSACISKACTPIHRRAQSARSTIPDSQHQLYGVDRLVRTELAGMVALKDLGDRHGD